MQYITGIHALNLPCKLETCGDWHTDAIQWIKPDIRESDGSIFGDYGIEEDRSIPYSSKHFYIANHIRALLDLIEEGSFGYAQGMKDDFIVVDTYTDEIFKKVFLLKKLKNFDSISRFMGREYGCRWLEFLKKQNENG